MCAHLCFLGFSCVNAGRGKDQHGLKLQQSCHQQILAGPDSVFSRATFNKQSTRELKENHTGDRQPSVSQRPWRSGEPGSKTWRLNMLESSPSSCSAPHFAAQLAPWCSQRSLGSQVSLFQLMAWNNSKRGPLVVFMGQVKSDRTWAQQRATNASSSERFFFSGLLPNNLEVS